MAGALAASSSIAAVPTLRPIVSTGGGAVAGIADEPGVFAWRGIPYAAPPIGPRRWRPPAPAARWRGVRDAAAFGPTCPQASSRLGHHAAPMSEDCLTLSVVAPRAGGRSWPVARGRSWPLAGDSSSLVSSGSLSPSAGGSPPGRRLDLLPVMVWIHGGAFLGGASSLPLYDGAALARRGVVFVALNYRLGALGWLAHPALSAEDPDHVSGNYGLLDQIEALRWVSRNIAAFGGDPDAVTVFGQSAGATSIRALLIAPSARGLFARAILESPAAGYPMSTLAEAERAGAALGRDAAWLRARSAAALVPLGQGFAPPSDTLVPMRYPAPVVDGHVIPRSWDDAVRTGTVARVPVLVGSNQDEGLLFARALPVKSAVGFAADLARMFGPLAARAARFYPDDTLDDARASAVRLVGAQRYTIGAADIARDMAAIEPDTWRYEFTRHLGDGIMPPTHAAELPYVFGTLSVRPFDGVGPNVRDVAVSDRMEAYWVRFAQTGDPNGPGLPRWPREASGREVVLDAEPSVAVPPDRAAIALIASRYAERDGAASASPPP